MSSQSSITTQVRRVGFKNLASLISGFSIVWLSCSIYAVYLLVNDKKLLFRELVYSHQQDLASGHSRVFVETLDRDQANNFGNIEFCWLEDTVECGKGKNSSLLNFPVEIPVYNGGKNPIGWVRAQISLNSIFQLTIGNFFGFAIVGALVIWILFRWRRTTADIQESLQNAVLETLKSGDSRSITELPEEVRPLGLAFLQSVTHINEVKTAQQRDSMIAAIATQVAHDIRSPLTALQILSETLSMKDERQKNLFRNSIFRIRDIANNLHSRNVIDRNGITTCLIGLLVDAIVSEKRIQYTERKNVDLKLGYGPEFFSCFASVNPVEFKRVISNLIDNSFDALDRDGCIQVSLVASESRINLKVSDDGPGISPDILCKLTNKGATFGKASGQGLGLYHAKIQSTLWSGKLEILSEGQGTEVVLDLPRAQPPAWFVPKLELEDVDAVVVLDDEKYVHDIWKSRVSSRTQLNLHHFYSSDEASRWVSTERHSSRALYLIDQELFGSSVCGLDFIRANRLEKNSILVTNRFEELFESSSEILKNIRVLPKSLAERIPISFGKA